MTILVLGSSGCIGGAIADKLLHDGKKLRLFLRPGAITKSSLSSCERMDGDLGDLQSLIKAAEGCDTVIHAAGLSNRHSSARALDWIHVAGTENALNAARYCGVQRFIYLSCADTTLINADRLHWSEAHQPSRPLLGDHAKSKALAEEVALCGGGSSMRVLVLRPSTVWGAGDTSELPRLCEEIMRCGRLQLPGRGDNFLSLIHIESLGDAVASCLQSGELAEGLVALSDTCMVSAGQFYSMLSEVLGAPPPRRLPYVLSYAQATWRERRRQAGLWRADVALRGRSTLFDLSRASRVLEFAPRQELETDMQALGAWVGEQGGVQSLAALQRHAAQDAEVDAQVHAAGGD